MHAPINCFGNFLQRSSQAFKISLWRCIWNASKAKQILYESPNSQKGFVLDLVYMCKKEFYENSMSNLNYTNSNNTIFSFDNFRQICMVEVNLVKALNMVFTLNWIQMTYTEHGFSLKCEFKKIVLTPNMVSVLNRYSRK